MWLSTDVSVGVAVGDQVEEGMDMQSVDVAVRPPLPLTNRDAEDGHAVVTMFRAGVQTLLSCRRRFRRKTSTRRGKSSPT